MRGRQLRGRQEVEVLADGAVGRWRAGDDSVDLLVGSREERLVDDTWNDEVAAFSELPQLRVAQHERYEPSAAACRRSSSASSGNPRVAALVRRSEQLVTLALDDRSHVLVGELAASDFGRSRCRGERDGPGRCLHRLGVRERAERRAQHRGPRRVPVLHRLLEVGLHLCPNVHGAERTGMLN